MKRALSVAVLAMTVGVAAGEFESKAWKLGPFTTRKGNIVTVDIPTNRPSCGAATLPFDFSQFRGEGFEATIRARGFNLTTPKETWLGFKFMGSYSDTKTGRQFWPGAAHRAGTWDWQTVRFSDMNTRDRSSGQLTLGLQSGGGRVEFDLSTLVLRELPPLWPATNLTHRCVYSPRVQAWPIHRGVMLGHGLKEADFKVLHDWGVTLARFQMTRGWNTPGANRDLADYGKYIDGCLDDLEHHLVWAKKYGIKLVVDLHAAPGARDEEHDEYMFHDQVYADAFIATWRKIATRFRGREEIFGFDLINEPQQHREALPGCDYWTLQSRAAEAIRAIDPETPIIVESNLYDSPQAFAYMHPLALTNIIYQAHMYVPMEFTHQGVFDGNSPVTVYPDAKKGWDIDYLRRTLQPVIDFQKRHGARIYLGEFSAIVWGEGADAYIRDCITVFRENGWDWTYHAFREWPGWSVEHEAPKRWKMVPSADNPRKRALLDGFREVCSGVYPHLAMVNDEDECGTGAVVPWAGKLWVTTYGPHCPTGSSDKLYEIGPELSRKVRPESVGGTHAERLVHRETGKLLIGQHLIASNGTVETVWISRMPGRLTGAARHLADPARKVYVTDMEEALYELDVVDPTKTFTLIRDGHNRSAFEAFFRRWKRTPPPGWNEAEESKLFGYHGKGTCSGFGKVFYANNGMSSAAAMRDPRTPSGCLAQWRPGMKNWELVRTNQFTEITTRDGIYGNEHPFDNPIWALGWDHRSVILTTTADGEHWHDYRLPKGSHSYDGAHGWNTEWPRIREIGEGDDFLATMHGTFWKFPANFAPGRAAGVRPRSTYLKVIGDFCRWGSRVVFGCDDHAKSEFLNVRELKGRRAQARRSESNLWFVEPSRLDALGPREGRGAVWSGDRVRAGQVSDPYLAAGYDRRWLWLTVSAEVQFDVDGNGRWQTWRELAPGGHALDSVPAAEWIRLVAKSDAEQAFAVFHYASERREVAEPAFAFKAPDAAAKIFENDAPIPQGLIGADAASLVYVDHGVRRRLPRRTANSAATCGRLCREVSTERDLLHVGELFYELPADNAGGFKFVHPVCATPRPVSDYDTWKGCLVLKENGELKIGVADDLWRLGKPVGVGGPWKETAVKAGEASDAYLMNGFDLKTLTLQTNADATLTLEADIDGCGTWIVAGAYAVKAGEPKTEELPRAFSAYWVRTRADVDCVASAQFLYR